ncbi:uncharacterized protein LOC134213901 [Armigeres subalbatus]|uniref:uncharacterized protein LOC134213901 n=1 Tax=Armigeres subalbatus TaxID=124917 RepID=UPI002ED63738
MRFFPRDEVAVRVHFPAAYSSLVERLEADSLQRLEGLSLADKNHLCLVRAIPSVTQQQLSQRMCRCRLVFQRIDSARSCIGGWTLVGKYRRCPSSLRRCDSRRCKIPLVALGCRRIGPPGGPFINLRWFGHWAPAAGGIEER